MIRQYINLVQEGLVQEGLVQEDLVQVLAKTPHIYCSAECPTIEKKMHLVNFISFV